ncbi:hypothetical protein GALMADRAFT_145134 [Galerina marginata CBS 339.88]|uniref:Uncharacterized protein n=1 Tax=Galerina marginata (strain CBS 339.88) TaxID=685588 RepID=A0A067SFJ7_GALM3|nr:hypothetical protein GALMADRAFT_145134 [Galerina marginata CBS 339.88]
MEMATADPGNPAGHVDEGGINEDHKDKQSTPASLVETSSAAHSRGRSFSPITDDDNDLSILAQYARPSVRIFAPFNEVQSGRVARVGAQEAKAEETDTTEEEKLREENLQDDQKQDEENQARMLIGYDIKKNHGHGRGAPASTSSIRTPATRSRGGSGASTRDHDDKYSLDTLDLLPLAVAYARDPPTKLSHIVEPEEAENVGATGAKALGDGVGHAEAEDAEAEYVYADTNDEKYRWHETRNYVRPGQVDVDDDDGGADADAEADHDGVIGLLVSTSASIARWSSSGVLATSSHSPSHFHSHSPFCRGSFSSDNDNADDGLSRQQDHPCPRPRLAPPPTPAVMLSFIASKAQSARSGPAGVQEKAAAQEEDVDFTIETNRQNYD